jgi:hypothetical protein
MQQFERIQRAVALKGAAVVKVAESGVTELVSKIACTSL